MISALRNKRTPQSHSQAGFTLLEIMIAMAIMIMIAGAIFQATTQTFKLREVLSTEGDFHNGIRLAIQIIQRDVALIYTPTLMRPNRAEAPPDPLTGVPSSPNSGQELGDDLGQSFKYWSPALDSSGLRPSRFQGSDTKMSFISLSHIRIYQDSTESEFAKISYELRPDTGGNLDRRDDQKPGMVLVKTEDSNAFNKEERKDNATRTYPVLHGIRKLSFLYYQQDGNTWKSGRSWDSDKDETKNKFPDIIEVQLEVMGPHDQTFTGTFKFRPEIPVNGLYPSY
jgi:general secretion pathway protein J